MTSKFNKVICGFFTEAKTVCGSEGLYQSIFYHHARAYFGSNKIRREEPATGGKIDFLIEDTDCFIAIEIKAGANGHRNSLANMKEVESKGKGLQHDLTKLHSVRASKPIESWLVCVDLAPLGIAFSQSDLEKYSQLSNNQGTNFAYISQLDNEYLIWIAGEQTAYELQAPQNTSPVDPWQLLGSNALWAEYYSELGYALGPECSHVGLFYHSLRRSGLLHNQIASEVFFNCTRYGTRQYHIPDFAVFTDGFGGHFQLYGNNQRTIQNDQYKLPALVSVLEFKGGDAFISKPIRKRKEEIISDVEKLAYEIKPRIEAASCFQDRSKAVRKPLYTMVVTDNDPRLHPCIEELKSKYKNAIEIRWLGA